MSKDLREEARISALKLTRLALRLQNEPMTPREEKMFNAGWEAALTFKMPAEEPQPVAGWRERCVVERCSTGGFDVVSPCGRCWLGCFGDAWMRYGPHMGRGVVGSFVTEKEARAALAACPTPPPGA